MRLGITLITALLCMTTGCVKSPHTEYMEVMPEHIHASMDGGSFDIDVKGSCDWVTDNTADWISIRKETESASICIAPNTGAERSRTITFLSGRFQALLTVSQDCSDAFAVSPASVHSGYRGGTFTFDVECYDEWKAESSADWLTVSPSQSNSPESVTITVSQSSEKEDRIGKVVFKNGERTAEVTVTQGPSPYIALEKDEVHIDGDGGIIHVLYLSNTETNITTEDPWIRLIDLGTDEKKIAFEVLRNMAEARKGHITVTSLTDSDYIKLLTVNQGNKIDHPSIRFEEGYSLDVSEKTTLTLHPIFEDMHDTGLVWSSGAPDIASVDQQGNVRILSNGQCTISAKNFFHNQTAQILLNIRMKATDIHIFFGEQDMEANPLAVRFPGEILHVRTAMSPEDAYSGDFVCISSDPSVAEVNGMEIRCLAPGSASITVESLYHRLRKSADVLILEN